MSLGDFSFVQLGPVFGLEAQVVKGLYVGIEQQVLLSYLDGDDDNNGFSAITTRSLLALRVMF